MHRGKALAAAWRIAGIGVVTTAIAWLLCQLAGPVGKPVAVGVLAAGIAFLGFTFWFFRDPEPSVPSEAGLIVAPAHGTIDVIEDLPPPSPIQGPCRRLSIFLSVFDVHVQQAPVAGRILQLRHTPGAYMNALKTESATHNENVLLTLECSDPPGRIVGLRLIAGLIARRIIPWTHAGDSVQRGQRISLIQFGSRVDLYLPPDALIDVKPGQRVVGGETVMARLRS